MKIKCKFGNHFMRDRVCDGSCEWFNTCTRRYAIVEGDMNMKTITVSCPKCGAGRTGICDVVRNVFNEVYRERECKNCATTFYTMEYVVEENETFKKEWDELHKDMFE